MTALSPDRLGRITGSRVSAILGLNPYQSRADVLAEMIAQAHGQPASFQGNNATRYGQEHEADAVAAYQASNPDYEITRHGRWQEFIIHPVYPFIGVTPDGFVNDDGLVECKCPPRAHYRHYGERLDYCAQMQLAMDATGRDWCDFVVWRPGDVAVSRLYADPWFIEDVMPDLTAFMDDYSIQLAFDQGKW